MPEYHKYGKWSILSGAGKPGDRIGEGSILVNECDNGYTQIEETSYCYSGRWTESFECQSKQLFEKFPSDVLFSVSFPKMIKINLINACINTNFRIVSSRSLNNVYSGKMYLQRGVSRM